MEREISIAVVTGGGNGIGAALCRRLARDNVKVVVDPASAQLLEGATLDYKDGLDQSGFAITNPNATRSCGCGQSFS